MKIKTLTYYLIFIVGFLIPNYSLAIETLGGELTWRCSGNSSYVFELVLYRDCNENDVTSTSEIIRVWNHGVLTDFPVNLVNRTNISPSCSPNSTSLPQLACGVGSNSGNGIGAVEKLVFQSSAIQLTGIPPKEGWIFTYETSSRKSNLTNLESPSTSGMTLVAKIFQSSSVDKGCFDNSPRFLEDPYLVVCSGTPYLYMPNCVDEDLDSLSFSLVQPLNSFPTGNFNPPTNPIFSSFKTGYTYLSPTPSSSINSANIPFLLDSKFGDITFQSQNTGQFVYKISVSSFRNGKKIAEVEREMVVFIVACSDNNKAPIVSPPTEFGLSFEQSFSVGSVVNMTINSSDNEFLQDGTTPQENYSTVTSLALPIAQVANGIQASANVITWNSTCSHLKNNFGNEFQKANYYFVVKVQDNYCQIPKYTYKRIKIELSQANLLNPVALKCVENLANGDIKVSWEKAIDPTNSFIGYELHSVQNGLLASISDINIQSYTVPSSNQINQFFVKTISGNPCSIALSSDTMSNIQLELLNSGDGTAVLSWNNPFYSKQVIASNTYEIFREYPVGTWTMLNSVADLQRKYTDTIDICNANLNYNIVENTPQCKFSSSITGGVFNDRIGPFAPIISTLSIDTLTNEVELVWEKPSNKDVFAYVIYLDGIEFDTVYGKNNTSYSTVLPYLNSSIEFSVAAFDSCVSQFNPLYNQTSAKSEPHETIFLTYNYDVCLTKLVLKWSNYVGWKGIEYYEILGKKENEPWTSFGKFYPPFSLQNAKELVLEEFKNYQFVLLAKDSLTANVVLSNKIKLYAKTSTKPTFNYLKVATVTNNYIEVRHLIDSVSGVSALALERSTDGNEFVEVQRLNLAARSQFIDNDVDPLVHQYRYRVRIIDSCGYQGLASNEAQPILLKVKSDPLTQINYLTWTKYEGFNGSILYYNVYKGFDGQIDFSTSKTVSLDHLHLEDTIPTTTSFKGEVCYLVQAIESDNIYGESEFSLSNLGCTIFEPLIYIPNAFSPNGNDNINPIFKPIVHSVDLDAYNFSIVDRWGQVIFQTKELAEGWDGTIMLSGQQAPVGNYMYVLKIIDGNQQEIIKRGFVNLIR